MNLFPDPKSKAEWRHFFRKRLGELSQDLRRCKQILFQKNINSCLGGKTGTWGAYLALPEELNLETVLEQNSGIDWVFPRVEQEEGLVFYRSTRFVRSAYGILEPENPSNAERVAWGDFSGLLIPGLGFNTQGVRIGRGKGYYDGFLHRLMLETRSKQSSEVLKIGVGFSEQVVEAEIPMEPHDVSMDIIVSDGAIWRR